MCVCVQICIPSICGTVTILYCKKSHFYEYSEDKHTFYVNCIVFDSIFDHHCGMEYFYSICGTMIVSTPNVFPENPCSYKASFSMHAIAIISYFKF